MRNPFRRKNLNRRFLPVACLVAAGLVWADSSTAAMGLGLAWMLCGLVLRGWGAGHLVKRDQLTQTGPYAYLRHPLYAGTLLICAGFGIAMGPVGWLLLTATGVWFLLSYFPAKEMRESDLMEQRYGLAYVSYRARVPALVPHLSRGFPPRSESSHWSLAQYSENNELGTVLGVAAGVAFLAFRMVSA